VVIELRWDEEIDAVDREALDASAVAVVEC